MINNKEFTIRLEKIFNHYDINAASFAEKIGIGRSSVSHIISGRNKPSLDFVMHILDNFSEITFDWLVYGKGNLGDKKALSENQIFEKKKSIDTATPSSNLATNLFNSSNNKEDGIKMNENVTANNFNAESVNTNSSPIESITIFYKDGTFKQYSPK